MNAKAAVSTQSFNESNQDSSAKVGIMQSITSGVKSLGKRETWLGDYDWAHMFTPRLNPWTKNERAIEKAETPFYGLEDKLPILLAATAGLQHALAMLAGLITPPVIIAEALYLDADTSAYLISASLISAGILSAVQMSRIPLFGGYQLGTGLLSVVGTSFATLSTTDAIIKNLYSNGTCQTIDGVKQACPDAYGYILGTAALCSLLEIGLSFAPIKVLKKIFPPLITGPVVFLIGASLVQSSGFPSWGGGSSCGPSSRTTCLDPHGYEWGDARYIGLGFLSFMTVVVLEIFGSPAMRNASIVLGLLIPLVVAGPLGYTSKPSGEVITFLWVHTFKLRVYGPAILPLLAVYISLLSEAIGDITATSEVSRLSVTSKKYDRRLQGGILSDGIGGCLSALFTITPMSVFAQNNGVIAFTRIANRRAGYWCCFWLILAGVLGKVAGAILAIPASVLGGVTTVLFSSVAVSGLRVIAYTTFTRRTRFILTLSLGLGLGNLLVPTWFAYFFTYSGSNNALAGFLESITIIVETPFLICAITGIIANLILPLEKEDREVLARAQEALKAEEESEEVEQGSAGVSSEPEVETDHKTTTSSSGDEKISA